jgi:hypothetical protein
MPHIPKRAVQSGPAPSSTNITTGVRPEVLATQPKKKLEIKQVEPPVRHRNQLIDRVSPWDYDVDPDEIQEIMFPDGIKAGVKADG